MSNIPSAIPEQSYELIRDRIAEILADELPAQATLTGDAGLNATIYSDRIIPIGQEEVPLINVLLSKGDYNNRDIKQSDGQYQFYIDVYTKSKTDKDNRGDVKAMRKLNRLLGVCRAIIQDTRYVRLGFAAPFIQSREISNLSIAQPLEKNLETVVMGRLTLDVKASETVELLSGNIVSEYSTQVKLYETDKGYIFSGEDIPVPPPDEEVQIQINGSFLANVDCGDTANILVFNSATDSVGTIVGANVDVGDGVATLKDEDGNVLGTANVPAEGAANLTAPNATINDSAGTLLYSVTSGGTQAISDATANLKDSGGGALGSTSILAQGSEDITAPDGQVDVNGSSFDQVLSGGTLNVPVRYENGTAVPTSIVGGVVEVPDPVDCPSLTLSVSNASPNSGETITLTATPSDITPTSYLFWMENGTDCIFLAEQASNTYNHTIAEFGDWDMRVEATDGTLTGQVYGKILLEIQTYDRVNYLKGDGINDYCYTDLITKAGANPFSYRFLLRTVNTGPLFGWSFQQANNGSGGTRRQIFSIDSNGYLAYADTGNNYPGSNIMSTDLRDGNWNDIVITKAASASQVKVYLNGALVNTIALSELNYGGSLYFQLFSSTLGGFGGVFDIDELRWWKGYELSATDVSDLYNSGNFIASNTIAPLTDGFYYLFNEPEGTDTGNLADDLGNFDLTMSGFNYPTSGIFAL